MWNIIAPIIGAGISAYSNQKAADTYARAQTQAAQVGADAIREGNQQAQETLTRLQTIGAPGVQHMRTVVNQGEGLTPEQQFQLEEQRRQTGNMIRSSSLAGSGRTAAALLRRGDIDFTNRAIEANRGRMDRAAGNLMNTYTAAAGDVARVQAREGEQVGGIQSGAIANSGTAQGNATTATGKVMGETIGDIGAIIAAEGRESRYRDRMDETRRRLSGLGD